MESQQDAETRFAVNVSVARDGDLWSFGYSTFVPLENKGNPRR